MRRRALIGGVLLAAALAPGCGSDTKSVTRTVEKTRVEEVVSPLPKGRFDPARIYARDAPGVVTVRAIGGGVGRGSLGSGFVISGGGEIATNAHVVTTGEGKAIRKLGEVYVEFADGNNVAARIVGFDPFADIALLKIDPTGLTLRPLPLGSAKDAVVGAPVAAIGSPFGEEQSLSVGFVSAIGRPIGSLTDFDTTGAIQTDAAINHGNSGGPLLSADGKVLGINAQIRSESGDNTGVGFAISVDTVKRSVEQIRKNGRVRYAYLGIATTTVYPQAAVHFRLPVSHGAWIQEVTSSGPGVKAGLHGGRGAKRFQARAFATGGDIIVRVGDRPIRQDTDVAQALLSYLPGQSVPVEIYRDGRKRQVSVKLGERPLSTSGRG